MIFQLRIPDDLHKALRLAAFQSELSMNKYILEAILRAIQANEKKGE